MSIILSDNKKRTIKALQKLNEIVVEVSQKVLYAFPKSMFSHSSEEKFLEFVKKELGRFHHYEVGDPEIIEVKKL